MTNTKKSNGTEVNNEVLTFNASIYQLDKTGNEVTFEYKLNGTTKNFNVNKTAKLLSERTFKIMKAQQNIAAKGMKQRFFGLSKTKKLYFWFSLDGSTILETEQIESVKVNISDVGEAEALQIVLTEIIEIFANNDNIEL